MNRELNRACYALQDWHAMLKVCVSEGDFTDEELKEEYGYNLRELENALAEIHRIRTSE